MEKSNIFSFVLCCMLGGTDFLFMIGLYLMGLLHVQIGFLCIQNLINETNFQYNSSLEIYIQFLILFFRSLFTYTLRIKLIGTTM